MNVAGIVLDSTNLGIVGAVLASSATLYGAIAGRRKQLDDREDRAAERMEREIAYWKTEAELWRRRHTELLESMSPGGGKWPETK